MQPVESRQIAAIGHDADTNTLAIRFKNWKGVPTSLYHYQNFTAEDFAAFRDAESKDKFFALNIKAFPDRHPYTKIEDAAPAAAA